MGWLSDFMAIIAIAIAIGLGGGSMAIGVFQVTDAILLAMVRRVWRYWPLRNAKWGRRTPHPRGFGCGKSNPSAA